MRPRENSTELNRRLVCQLGKAAGRFSVLQASLLELLRSRFFFFSGKLRRDCSWLPASFFISVRCRDPCAIQISRQLDRKYVHAATSPFCKHTLTQHVYKNTHRHNEWLVSATSQVNVLWSPTTEPCCGNRSFPSLIFSFRVSPSFFSANAARLPCYQDSPKTACPGSCHILCARMSAGPSEMPAASETSISTRDMVKEGEQKEKEREAEKRRKKKTATKSWLSTKGSQTESWGFLLSSQSCVKITTLYNAKRTRWESKRDQISITFGLNFNRTRGQRV